MVIGDSNWLKFSSCGTTPMQDLARSSCRSMWKPKTLALPPALANAEATGAAAALVDQRGDDADQRSLAGAVRTQQREEIALLDVQIDAAQRVHAILIGLRQSAGRQGKHGSSKLPQGGHELQAAGLYPPQRFRPLERRLQHLPPDRWLGLPARRDPRRTQLGQGLQVLEGTGCNALGALGPETQQHAGRQPMRACQVPAQHQRVQYQGNASGAGKVAARHRAIVDAALERAPLPMLGGRKAGIEQQVGAACQPLQRSVVDHVPERAQLTHQPRQTWPLTDTE